MPEETDFLDIDFGAVATAFGAHGETVRDPEQVKPALARAEESAKPVLINVVVAKNVTPPVGRYAAAGGRTICRPALDARR